VVVVVVGPCGCCCCWALWLLLLLGLVVFVVVGPCGCCCYWALWLLLLLLCVIIGNCLEKKRLSQLDNIIFNMEAFESSKWLNKGIYVTFNEFFK
jgi:hypothetical protein